MKSKDRSEPCFSLMDLLQLHDLIGAVSIENVKRIGLFGKLHSPKE